MTRVPSKCETVLHKYAMHSRVLLILFSRNIHCGTQRVVNKFSRGKFLDEINTELSCWVHRFSVDSIEYLMVWVKQKTILNGDFKFPKVYVSSGTSSKS